MMQYNPSVPPQIDEDLLPYLSEEFLRVAQVINGVLAGQQEINHTLPIRLKPGWVGYLSGGPEADPLGTGEEGLYRYGTKGWVYIG